MPRGELSDDEGDRDDDMDTDESERPPVPRDQKPIEEKKTQGVLNGSTRPPMVNGMANDAEKDQDPNVRIQDIWVL